MESNVEVGNTKIGDMGVSRLCFGTYQMIQRVKEPIDAINLMQQAYESGINFFDTADQYGPSEALIRFAISQGILPKDKVVIATKVGYPTTGDEYADFKSRNKLNENGMPVDASPARIRQQVDKSLSNLGIDAIGIYQIHDFDPSTSHLEVISAMNDLINDGKIRHYGFSNYTQSEVLDSINACRENGFKHYPISLQNLHNIANPQDPLLIEVALNNEVGMKVESLLE